MVVHLLLPLWHNWYLNYVNTAWKLWQEEENTEKNYFVNGFYRIFSHAVPVQANISLTRTVYPIGSDISIPCDVDGYPIPQVVWYKDEELLEPSERIHITGEQKCVW
jgi:hypothetical protein